MNQSPPPELLQDLLALPDDRSEPDEAAAWPCYRSEAFAEDLVSGGAVETAVVAVARPTKTLLLWVAPVVAALCGGALTLFGVVT